VASDLLFRRFQVAGYRLLNLYARIAAGSIGMARPQAFELDFDIVKEPDDLWNKLFFAWLKNLGEQTATSLHWFSALEEAIVQLDTAVAKLQPERSDELVAAMKAIQELREVWSQQSTRSLDNVENIAVIIKQIAASQKKA